MIKAEKRTRKKLGWKKRLVMVLAIIIAVIVAFLAFSYFTIRHFTGDSLSFKGTLAMLGYGGMNLPKGLSKFILDVDRSYEGLPSLLTADDGTVVSTEAEYEVRRAEILEKVEKYLYGKTPSDGFSTTFEIVESGEALESKAIREQVKITTTTTLGSHEAMLLVYRPKGKTNVAMFVGENFGGNTTVLADESIIPSFTQGEEIKRGTDSSFDIEKLIDNGVGFATMSYLDWAADDEGTFREGILSVFPEGNETAFTAWSFGIMRAVDYLYSTDYVNKDAIATCGHSRLACVSLWAGAQDTRIALVTASCGGGLFRSDILGKITTTSNTTHWFTKEYFSFEGRDDELPVDMHMLFALTAKRHLYISMGASDLAADPVGMYDGLQKAKVVWKEIFGIDVIPDGDYYDLTLDEPVFSEGIATHVHKGAHKILSVDWDNYLAYLNEYVLK